MTPSQTRNDDASAELRFAKSRRRFLQGVGACLALPSMESLFSQRVEAAAARASGGLAATASGVPKRMAFVYFPNGAIQPTWWPKGDPKDFDLNTTMKPLEPIKGIGAVPCSGHRNIPDGECFSCPIRESVNGVVQYNTVSLYQGTEFKDIRFVVKNGRIVEACASGQDEKINHILDTDEGARYFGEWSLGYNPFVLHPMKDTLFDEKIAGSFHLTPGNAYTGPGGNGNKSSLHWDIVNIQRPDYGGGEVHFDGKLIRKDGLFVLPELERLNPDKLGR